MIRAAALAALLAGPVAAEGPPCAPSDAMALALASRWGEAVVAAGDEARGGRVEWWANPATGSWTITVTRPDGQTCVVAAGVAFAATTPGTPT